MDAGFVAVGRLHPLKRQHRLIEIIDSLRDAGVDTHLHIVGPVGDDQYAGTLADRAASRPYVHLEGEIPRAKLISLLESHRYGIHGRRFEHFGIAVAEMVASRTVPFVHASGGQQEVVGNIDRLCYADHDDAVEKITGVTTSSTAQRTLLDDLSSTGIPGEPEQFRTAICEAVKGHLDGN